MHVKTAFASLALFALVAGCSDPVSTSSGIESRTAVAEILTTPPTCPGCLLGPITVVRMKGAVRTDTWRFDADPAADYILEVRASGGPGNNGEVTLNGMVLKLRSNQGDEPPDELRIPVTLNASNELSVRLHGAPGQEVTFFLQGGVKTVDETGGVVRAPGGHSIAIPAGALSSSTEVQIIASIPPPTDASLLQFAAPMFTLLPDGLAFAAPVTLRIGYDPQEPAPQYLIAVQYLGSDNLLGWQASTVDAGTATVAIPLMHFSQYSLVKSGALPASGVPYRYRLFGCPSSIGGQRYCGNFRTDLLIAFGQWKASAQSVGVRFQETFGTSDIDIRFGTWSAGYSDVFPALAGWDLQNSHRTIVLSSGTEWWDVNGTPVGQSGIMNLGRVVSHGIGHLLGLSEQGANSVMGGSFSSTPIALSCAELTNLGTVYGVSGLGSRCLTTLVPSASAPFGYPTSLAFVFFTARDANGAPVDGQPIVSQVTAGGGTSFNLVTLTFLNGASNLLWRLGGSAAQLNTLHAFAPNVPAASVNYNVTTIGLSALPAPAQIAPTDQAVFSNLPRTVTLTWSAVAGAVAYEYEVEACFIWTLPDFWTCAPALLSGLSGLQLPTTAAYTHVGAQPGRWHVRARDGSLTPGPWSPWRSFNFTQ